ncbi:MAG: type II toxin-antitoxin system HicB family antitoxin [Patescibacteria group bacterium]
MSFTAVYQKHGNHYLGWVEEVSGVNTQGETLAETKANLKDALIMILEANRMLAERARPRGRAIREKIRVRV